MKQLIISTDDIISRLAVPHYERFNFLTLEEYSSQQFGREMHDLASIAMARRKHYVEGLPERSPGRYYHEHANGGALGHVTIMGVYGDDISARKEFDYNTINPTSLPVLMIAGRLYVPVVPDPVYQQLRAITANQLPAAGRLPVLGQEALTELKAGEGVSIDQIDWSARCSDVFVDDEEYGYFAIHDQRMLMDTCPAVILPEDALPELDDNYGYGRPNDVARLMLLANAQGKTLKELTGYDVKVYLFDYQSLARGEAEEAVPAE